MTLGAKKAWFRVTCLTHCLGSFRPTSRPWRLAWDFVKGTELVQPFSQDLEDEFNQRESAKKNPNARCLKMWWNHHIQRLFLLKNNCASFELWSILIYTFALFTCICKDIAVGRVMSDQKHEAQPFGWFEPRVPILGAKMQWFMVDWGVYTDGYNVNPGLITFNKPLYRLLYGKEPSNPSTRVHQSLVDILKDNTKSMNWSASSEVCIHYILAAILLAFRPLRPLQKRFKKGLFERNGTCIAGEIIEMNDFTLAWIL